MKKVLFVCLILFIAGIACKKEDIGGGGLCACSPITGPQLDLVIKNTAGDDLLDPKIAGAYSKDKIQLYRKYANGKVVPVDFTIRPTFLYNTEKFNYQTLHAEAYSALQASADNIMYLNLGGDKIYELKLILTQQKYNLDRLLIDNQDAEKDKSNVAKYVTIFYLTK